MQNFDMLSSSFIFCKIKFRYIFFVIDCVKTFPYIVELKQITEHFKHKYYIRTKYFSKLVINLCY